MSGRPGGALGSQLDLDEDFEDWRTFRQFPPATQTAFSAAFARLADEGRNELCVLLLGKNGVGKSSTLNQLIGERKQKVNAYGMSAADKPAVISRSLALPARADADADAGAADAFVLTIIDTPGLLVGDRIHEGALELVADACASRFVDVVLYVDRLDVYDVSSLDRQVFAAISRVLGPEVWRNAMLVLTHGEAPAPSAAGTYEESAAARARLLWKAMGRESCGQAKVGAGGDDAAALPPRTCVVENGSKCKRNFDGEKVLPDGCRMLATLMDAMVEHALACPEAFEYTSRGKNPDKKKRWLVPLAFAAQVLVKRLLFDKVVKWDATQGDEWGPNQKEFQDKDFLAKINGKGISGAR